ncbi:NADH:flavin oxidoreductase / NADH oxidase family [Rhizoctonia solani]|uniref:NADH:flavin oxidoreductase / NADH oxidase family n=1 Tax=Rhizoctonia solani TaxID=456999 RepID=A0A8H7M9P5_9AGAM|nr:NADH:flavin oxidoreductase / NADH oxidase family [Rhizoctonia solani]
MDDSVTLPCGKQLRNRLVKAAMYEAMANFGGGPPTQQHYELYSRWATGGWGMIITGGRNPWTPPSAPSAQPMTPREGILSRLVFSILFQPPHPLDKVEIGSVVSAFVSGALVAYDSGFDGIQLHASHGYLLSQFLSIKNNGRTDDYGPPNELKLLHDIVSTIRAEPRIPDSFVIGVKLNAGDYAGDQAAEEHALSHVRSIAAWRKVDFLEISGGDYESPDKISWEEPVLVRLSFHASPEKP